MSGMSDSNPAASFSQFRQTEPVIICVINLVGNAEQASLRKVHLGGHLRSFLGEKCNRRVPGIKLKNKSLCPRGAGQVRGAQGARGWKGGQWPCKWQGK